MNESTVTTAESQAQPKAVKAKAKKPAPAKKSEGRARTVGDTTKTVEQRRAAVVKAMRRLDATSAMTAKTTREIAKVSGLTEFDTYGQLYHTHLLQSEGYVKQVKHEGSRSLSFYLTAKGQKYEG